MEKTFNLIPFVVSVSSIEMKLNKKTSYHFASVLTNEEILYNDINLNNGDFVGFIDNINLVECESSVDNITNFILLDEFHAETKLMNLQRDLKKNPKYNDRVINIIVDEGMIATECRELFHKYKKHITEKDTGVILDIKNDEQKAYQVNTEKVDRSIFYGMLIMNGVLKEDSIIYKELELLFNNSKLFSFDVLSSIVEYIKASPIKMVLEHEYIVLDILMDLNLHDYFKDYCINMQSTREKQKATNKARLKYNGIDSGKNEDLNEAYNTFNILRIDGLKISNNIINIPANKHISRSCELIFEEAIINNELKLLARFNHNYIVSLGGRFQAEVFDVMYDISNNSFTLIQNKDITYDFTKNQYIFKRCSYMYKRTIKVSTVEDLINRVDEISEYNESMFTLFGHNAPIPVPPIQQNNNHNVQHIALYKDNTKH